MGDDVHIIGYSKPTANCPDESNTVHPPVTAEAGLVIRHRKGPADVLEGRAVLERNQHPSMNSIDYTQLIQINEKKLSPQNVQQIHTINRQYQDVFQPSLINGYNGSAGSHTVKLHWADSSRPPANKMLSPRWSTNRDEILQRKMDQLTKDGVLLVPHEIDTQVKFVSNVFLQKKGRAAQKDLSECSNDERRLLCEY